jgi:hypothetical protein
MAIFAVLADPKNTALTSVIKNTFPKDFLVIEPGQYLVAAKTTAKDLSTQILGAEGQNGSAVILTVSSYHGRASPAVWEWIRTKWDTNGG